jgi:1-phosphatidylinositol phosphodiesterase
VAVSLRFRASLVTLAACASSPPQDPGWMAGIDDATTLSRLSIPGTHESGSLYEPLPGAGKCQRLTIAQQLDIGVRYFDIRCRDLDDAFAIYHGPVSQMQDFDQVVSTVLTFLDAHPTETVMMSVKEEGSEQGTTRSFEDTFKSYVAANPERWYLGDGVPALGDVRGQIVLVRRFPATTMPLGLDASGWQDNNTTFTLTTPAAMLRVEDAYTVSNNDDKWAAITAALTDARAAATTDPTLFLTLTSGYESTAGVPNVTSVSSVIDPLLQTYLEDPGAAHAHLGVIAMDFVDAVHTLDISNTNAP